MLILAVRNLLSYYDITNLCHQLLSLMTDMIVLLLIGEVLCLWSSNIFIVPCKNLLKALLASLGDFRVHCDDINHSILVIW